MELFKDMGFQIILLLKINMKGNGRASDIFWLQNLEHQLLYLVKNSQAKSSVYLQLKIWLVFLKPENGWFDRQMQWWTFVQTIESRQHLCQVSPISYTPFWQQIYLTTNHYYVFNVIYFLIHLNLVVYSISDLGLIKSFLA